MVTIKKAILLMLLASTSLFSQEIEKSEIDEFTGSKVIVTSWEPLSRDKTYSFYRLRQIDDVLIIDWSFVSLSRFKVFTVDAGENLMFLQANGNVIKMNVSDFVVSSVGGGSHNVMGSAMEGVRIPFILTNDIIDTIKQSPIVKYRIYTDAGFKEYEVKEKFYNSLVDALNLVNNG